MFSMGTPYGLAQQSHASANHVFNFQTRLVVSDDLHQAFNQAWDASADYPKLRDALSLLKTQLEYVQTQTDIAHPPDWNADSQALFSTVAATPAMPETTRQAVYSLIAQLDQLNTSTQAVQTSRQLGPGDHPIMVRCNPLPPSSVYLRTANLSGYVIELAVRSQPADLLIPTDKAFIQTWLYKRFNPRIANNILGNSSFESRHKAGEKVSPIVGFENSSVGLSVSHFQHNRRFAPTDGVMSAPVNTANSDISEAVPELATRQLKRADLDNAFPDTNLINRYQEMLKYNASGGFYSYSPSSDVTITSRNASGQVTGTSVQRTQLALAATRITLFAALNVLVSEASGVVLDQLRHYFNSGRLLDNAAREASVYTGLFEPVRAILKTGDSRYFVEAFSKVLVQDNDSHNLAHPLLSLINTPPGETQPYKLLYTLHCDGSFEAPAMIMPFEQAVPLARPQPVKRHRWLHRYHTQ